MEKSLIFLVTLTIYNTTLFSQEQNQPTLQKSFFEQDYLTGNWNGHRTSLETKGISIEAAYTAEVVVNTYGGINSDTFYLDNFDLIITIDAAKLFYWHGATFLVYFLSNYGNDPTQMVGDAQGTSNIEAPNTIKLYEAWYQQNLFEDTLSIKMGLYDLNSEFDVIETAGLFFNSSHGIGVDYSQSGENAPSIFPTTSLALRVFLQIAEHFYIQAAVLDGVPGDVDDAKGTHIILNRDALFAGEIGFTTNESFYAKIAVGAWYYTALFEEIFDNKNQRGNQGFYILGEMTLFQEQDPQQGLAIFARFGMADEDVNQFKYYNGAGFVYTGLFTGRDNDQIGIAVAIAYNGQDFIDAQGGNVDDLEANLELTYFAEITPWFSLQPDLQLVINPGTNPNLDNALVFAMRTVILF